MNSRQLKEQMMSFNKQNDEEKKATVMAVVAAIRQNLESLNQSAEEMRPLYELAKSMSKEEFDEQLRVLCDGDQSKFDAVIDMIWLIDTWGLL